MAVYERGGLHMTNLVTTEQIQEIVRRLNSPPFSKELTLVSFDEKSPPELLELFNEVLAHLSYAHKLEYGEKDEDAIYNLVEFLKVLNFPSKYDAEFQAGVVNGEKRTVLQVLHHILIQIPVMEKRAYLAKFLVNIYVPEDILMADDIKTSYQENKERQAEFQVIHQELEQLREQSLPPFELKKEIDQLETEKDQLVTKISRLKQKYTANREFNELLEATSRLRKEQEEEALLMEKLIDQQQQLEWCEGSYLAAEQRLMDTKKITAADTSALDMLNLLRTDVKRNREFCNERLGRELTEKILRLEQAEQLINEPMVTQNDLESLQNEVRVLQRDIQLLEEKANAGSSDQDKLGVYKQQAQLVSKKKEKSLDKLKQLEHEANKLEKKKMQKEKEYEQARGGNKFLSGDEFYRYAQSLRNKKAQAQQMRTQLRDIRAELTILNRTEQIVRQQDEDLKRHMNLKERQQGIEGYSQVKDGIEQASSVKEEFDIQKGATLEEISKIVETLTERVQANKARLQPQVNEVTALRNRHNEINTLYDAKKQEYDSVTAAVQADIGKLQADVKQLVDETTVQENKHFDILAKIQLSDALLKRIEFERSCRNDESKLNKDYKTLKNWYTWRMEQQDSIIRDFRNRQKTIKENHEINSQQVKMFGDLRKLLALKCSIVQDELGGRGALRGRDLGGEIGVGGVNRLVLGED